MKAAIHQLNEDVAIPWVPVGAHVRLQRKARLAAGLSGRRRLANCLFSLLALGGDFVVAEGDPVLLTAQELVEDFEYDRRGRRGHLVARRENRQIFFGQHRHIGGHAPEESPMFIHGLPIK